MTYILDTSKKYLQFVFLLIINYLKPNLIFTRLLTPVNCAFCKY